MNLRPVILALLSKEPNTGYGIGRLLRRDLSHLWNARLQQIYSELAKLEHEALVVAERAELMNRAAKKVYSLTPAGQQALDDWLAEEPAPLRWRDDLLLRLYCLERLPGELAVRRLEQRRDEAAVLELELRTRLEETRRHEPAASGSVLALEWALARVEGQAAWATRAISMLQKRDGAARLTTAAPLP